MTTTGCCDRIRHNNNTGDNRPNDRELFVMNGNLTSSSVEYPKPLTLTVGPSGPSNLSHRNRGHKRTKAPEIIVYANIHYILRLVFTPITTEAELMSDIILRVIFQSKRIPTSIYMI